MNTRSVLEYIPYFRGRLFIIHIAKELENARELVDSMLDLKALHDIGVHLIVLAGGWCAQKLLDEAIVCEMRVAKLAEFASPANAARIQEVLFRGQIAILESDENFSSPNLVELAVKLSASKYIALVDNAVPEKNSAPIAAIREDKVEEILPDVKHPQNLKAAALMCKSGIPRVHILNGRHRGVLLDEIFSEEGVGTMVHTDSYREIRPLKIEDIPELLSLIGRSVKNSNLVERTYEDVSQRLRDYFVITLDDSIVGSVALYPFLEEHVGEIACLYIKDQHANRGYGRLLVNHALAHAKELGLHEVFAVSQSARDFFQARLKFEERDRSSLPISRRNKLEQSGRHSSVFWMPVS